ncbi:hypothetical protein WJX74_010825 [Apatococcus lobatus]|uniref:NAD-dependent epimerase/dehydratase domain-containing protein n=1 Tax=Apatococcus lobatus TaxID=904363 RepID=A0AAW1R089_9CHLO
MQTSSLHSQPVHAHTCNNPASSRALPRSSRSLGAFQGLRQTRGRFVYLNSVPNFNSKASARRRQHLRVTAAEGQKLSVAISGASGLVGTRLVQKLTQQGAAVKVLSRNPEKSRSKLRYPGVEFFDPSQWQDAMRGIKGVINLAGEPIATRWNDRLKQEIKNSRVNMTTKLVAAINGLPKEQRPEVLVSASAVGTSQAR